VHLPFPIAISTTSNVNDSVSDVAVCESYGSTTVTGKDSRQFRILINFLIF